MQTPSAPDDDPYKKIIEHLINEINKLKEALMELFKRISDLTNRLSALERENNIIRKQNMDLHNENKRIVKQAKQQERIVSEILSDVRNLKYDVRFRDKL